MKFFLMLHKIQFTLHIQIYDILMDHTNFVPTLKIHTNVWNESIFAVVHIKINVDVGQMDCPSILPFLSKFAAHRDRFLKNLFFHSLYYKKSKKGEQYFG